MSRLAAFVVLLALSWSHVAGLRCHVAASAAAIAGGKAEAAAHAGAAPGGHLTAGTAKPLLMHHGPADADAPTKGGAPDGCLMIMACSIASQHPAPPLAVIRSPAVLAWTAFPGPPVPVAGDLPVETPPPRQTV